MTDSNPTRRRAAVNKKSFDDVIGDPFANDEAKQGHYGVMKHRSLLSATRNNFGEGAATINAARPNAVDFCVDVERVILKVLGDDEKLLHSFIDLYITGTVETIAGSPITQAERTYFEQRMGRLFLAYGISPVIRYFTTVRRADATRRPDRTKQDACQ